MHVEHFLPVAMIFSFVYSVTIFVQQIVYEKEKRLKEVKLSFITDRRILKDVFFGLKEKVSFLVLIKLFG